jgi:hypothetical protein
VQPATEKELKRLFKKDGWKFSWKREYKLPNRQIFKLLIDGSSEIQGLLSLEVIWIERYIEMHLIENAPHNYGRNKRYLGVPGNLVAFACKMSFDLGFDGHTAFVAKTKLIQHYKITLGAQNIFGNNRMAIFPAQAKKLVNSYFKNYLDDGQETILSA